MRAHRRASVIVALALATCGLAAGQQLPLEPSHNMGASVTGAFEGWFENADGTYSILVGYFSRNLRAAVDIPIGPNNQIQPGGPDRGQPTHFLPGRGWGLFTINVPKDFGDKTLSWTLTTNGVTTSIPLNIAPLWQVAPFVDATGDTPPYIGFSDEGPFANGPLGQTESTTATAGTPLPLTAWVADDAKSAGLPDGLPVAGTDGQSSGEGRERQPVVVRWGMFRGPGTVQFDKDMPAVEKVAQLKSTPPGTIFYGKVTSTATFSEPGQYMLSIQAFDSTGQGGDGFQCCWSTAKISVSVKPAATSGSH